MGIRPGGPLRRGRGESNLAALFEKLPPHAIEAEMSLLGCMLVDPQVISDVMQVIRTGDDFFKPAHGQLYAQMVELYDKRSSLDLVQLNQQLIDRGTLEDVGGVNYLVTLAQSVPSASSALHYARLVREKAMVRRLIEAAGDILHEAHHAPDEVQGLLDRAEQRIFDIAQQAEHSAFQSLKDLIDETMRMLEANEGRPITGVPTGFIELDELTSGLQRGEMVIVAARPSMGKTALALNVAEQMAVRGLPVGVFSLEMGKQQLVQRMLCARAGIDSQRLRRNMLRSEDYRQLMAACGELQQAPIYIDDTPGLSLLQLRAKARRMAQKFDIKAVFIDYLQLLTAGGRVESRQMEVSEISRGIKAMARELNVPVVCLSQLNRASEQREGHRPRMSDLRESGSIEQDADVVAMLHREEYYHQGDEEWMEMNRDKLGVAELIVAKQRNGPTGTIRLTWMSDSTRFRDYSPATPPGGPVGYGGAPPMRASGSAIRSATPSARPASPQPPPPTPDHLDDLPI